jgi:hypothetical protein
MLGGSAVFRQPPAISRCLAVGTGVGYTHHFPILRHSAQISSRNEALGMHSSSLPKDQSLSDLSLHNSNTYSARNHSLWSYYSLAVTFAKRSAWKSRLDTMDTSAFPTVAAAAAPQPGPRVTQMVNGRHCLSSNKPLAGPTFLEVVTPDAGGCCSQTSGINRVPPLHLCFDPSLHQSSESEAQQAWNLLLISKFHGEQCLQQCHRSLKVQLPFLTALALPACHLIPPLPLSDS